MLLKSQWGLFRNPNLHVSINPHSSTNRRDEGHSLTVGTTLTHPYGFRGKMPFWDHQISSFIQLHDGSRVGLHFCFKSLMLLKLALLVDHEVSQMQPLSTQSFCPPGTPIIPPPLNPTPSDYGHSTQHPTDPLPAPLLRCIWVHLYWPSESLATEDHQLCRQQDATKYPNLTSVLGN